MFFAEGADVALNTKNNNNIAWKNISIFDDDPNNIIEGPVSVFIGCEGQTMPGRLKIVTARNALNKPIQAYGTVYLRLREPLHGLWAANGSLGTGFTQQSDGRIRVNDEIFYLDGLPLDACENYVAEVFFEPAQPAFPCAFDLIQMNQQGNVVGGERFEYQPSQNMQRGEVDKISDILTGRLNIYPNPAHNQVSLAWPDDVPGKMGQVQVFDVLGVLIHQINLIGKGAGAIYTLDISAYPPGVYEVTIKGAEGGNALRARFVKQ